MFFQDNVAHFSFPFSFELFYKNDSVNEEDKGLFVCYFVYITSYRMKSIFFSINGVYSIDNNPPLLHRNTEIFK